MELTEPRAVYLFPNGNQGVCIAEAQVPALQEKAWLVLLFEHFEQLGYDPTTFEWHTPGGWQVRPYRTTDGRWNWEVIRP